MRVTLILLFVIIFAPCSSQALMDDPVQLREPTLLIRVIDDVEKKGSLKFFFLEDWMRGIYADANASGQPLRAVIDKAIEGTGISYVFMFGYAVIFLKDPAPEIRRQELLQSALESRKEITSMTVGDPEQFVPGRQVLLNGVVASENDGAKLEGVSVYVNDLNVSAKTNERGEYAIVIPSGNHVIEYQHLNFAERVVDMQIFSSGTTSIVLEERPTMLAEVEVSDQAILDTRVSQTSLQITNLKRSPTFVGEADVIKHLQSQPGVTTVGEIAGGFNVRGGSVDQNLVLYDGIPVLNTSHALGFFTAFNADNISNVAFYRGGIPAEYGGRISSVLSITSKEGNYKKWGASGGIGLITSHLSVGGPIKEDTTSLAFSFRTSYSNWMLRMVESNYQDLRHSNLSFYDGSGKLSHRFSQRTKLTVSGYRSNDEFTLTNDTIYSWKNVTGAVRVDHSFSSNLFSSFTLGYGGYRYQFTEPEEANAFQIRYGVSYPSFNADFNYAGPHSFSFGVHNRLYTFNPGELDPRDGNYTMSRIDIADERGIETAFYFGDAFQLTEKIFLEAGIRYSLFNQLGPARVFNYEDGKPREVRYTVDSLLQDGVVKTWHGAEPRFSMRYMLNAKTSLKLGYNRIFQYVHLISNTAAITPVDTWQMSNRYFKPQCADQLSLGYYKNISQSNQFEVYAETYYKIVSNVLEFKDGAELLLNDRLETALAHGQARAYGVEFSVAKVKGRLQGFLNYAYARSFRTVNNAYESERVNGGNEYASNHDQPHVGNFSWRYGISRRHYFSGSFTYHTGRPMSVPQTSYVVDGIPVTEFSQRNSRRIPDYHRLDFAFIIEGNHRLRKILDGTWVISFYNVYARKNAYSVFFRDNSAGQPVPYKLAIIGTMIPSVSYSFSL